MLETWFYIWFIIYACVSLSVCPCLSVHSRDQTQVARLSGKSLCLMNHLDRLPCISRLLNGVLVSEWCPSNFRAGWGLSIFLCSSDWLYTLSNPPASALASQMLGLQICASVLALFKQLTIWRCFHDLSLFMCIFWPNQFVSILSGSIYLFINSTWNFPPLSLPLEVLPVCEARFTSRFLRTNLIFPNDKSFFLVIVNNFHFSSIYIYTNKHLQGLVSFNFGFSYNAL